MKNENGFNIFVVILSVCFLALGGIFVKLSNLGPINTGFYRVLLSMPMLLPFAIKRKLAAKDIFIMMFAGVFLAFDLLLWNISFGLTTVANANLLANLVPFTIIPISYFLYKEKIPAGFLVGIVITLVGLVVLIKGKAVPTRNNLYGDFLAFSTSIFYALFLSTVYTLRKRVSATEIMFYSAFGSLLVLFPASCLMEGFQFPSDFSDWWPLLGLALFSQILGQGGLSYSLGRITPLLASVLVLSQPVISACYALMIFREKLSPMEMSGIFVVLSGIFFSKRSFNKQSA
ncbi:DMT family transporter [Dickeya oryzae]|uniref:DMT family transporter n=1 Tax=Dickeya oryzae TaxID=1240404 RepID=A0ABS5B6H6_9GAMM|nr:DMT family transporter [Dickeya oryzae]MBP2856063.1 DMT family transporter [Dickeya oryzae]